jgi:hypothetical protein
MASAGFGVILAPEHMPRLPTLKAIPLEGDPVSREVRLLAVQGRRYSPALAAFVKAARLRDWSVEAPQQGMQHGSDGRRTVLSSSVRHESQERNSSDHARHPRRKVARK